MKISSMLIVSLLGLITGIFLSYMLAQEEDSTIIINQPIFAQLGMPSDSILLNKTNMTTPTSPTITENITVTPAPEVNNTLIGRSTPTTSNTTLQFDNKTGETEPLGGIK
jgi:LPS O-antigen subunit length determinant protein (WzzB/FepE family)